MPVAIPAAPPPMPDSSPPPATAASSPSDSSASFNSMLQNGMAANSPATTSTSSNGQQDPAPPSAASGAPAPNTGGSSNSSEYSAATHQYSNSGGSSNTPLSPPASNAHAGPSKPTVVPPVAPTTAEMSILAAAIVPLQQVSTQVVHSVPSPGGSATPSGTSAPAAHTSATTTASVDSVAVAKNVSTGAVQVTTTTPLSVPTIKVDVPANNSVVSGMPASQNTVSTATGTAQSVQQPTGEQPIVVASVTPSAKSLKALQSMVTSIQGGNTPTTTQVVPNSGSSAQMLMNHVSRALTLQQLPKQPVPSAASASGEGTVLPPITFSKGTPISVPVGIAPPMTAAADQQGSANAINGSDHTEVAGTADLNVGTGGTPAGLVGVATAKPGSQTNGDGSGTTGGGGQGQTANQGRDPGGNLPQSTNVVALGQNGSTTTPGAVSATASANATTLQDQTAARIAVANQVANQIESQRLQNGNGRFVVNLHPAELGNVQVTVSQSKGVISARLVAETSQAQHALESGRQHLSQAFEHRGIKLQSLQISMNSGGAGRQGNPFQAQNQSNFVRTTQSGRNSSLANQPIPEEVSAGIPIRSIGSVVGSNAMLDYRA